MQVKIDWNNFSDFREIRKIVEYKDGQVFKTQHLKYVTKTYVLDADEISSPLSTSLVGCNITIQN